MLGYINKIVLLFIITLFLTSACVAPTTAPTNGAYDQIKSDLESASAIDRQIPQKKSTYIPLSVRNALLPSGLSHAYVNSNTTSNRFDVAADQTPAKTFYMGLVEGTPYNMVVNPRVEGTISIKLKNVTLDETMQAVRDAYGFDFHRTAYGYEVLPPEIHTEMFTINYLDVKRVGKSTTQMTSGDISQSLGSTGSTTGSTTPNTNNGNNNGSSSSSSGATYVPTSSVDTSSEMNFWHDLEATLKNMVGEKDGRSVVLNKQAGLIVIRAFTPELRQVARFLDRIQVNIERQVILEAKVLEVQLNDQFQSGINWNLLGHGFINDVANNIETDDGGANQYSTNTFGNTDLQDFNGILALNVIGNKFGTLIKLLQTQGNVQTLSSPRISTVNNQKAVIKVGSDQFYVTNVSSTTAVSGSATIPTQSVTLTPFFSGITLDVTPQISKDGSVILHIHPTVSVVTTQNQQITVGQVIGQTASGASQAVPNILNLPLAKSDIRESDDIVRAKNKQIIVIGGLMTNSMSETVAGTPLLSKLPFIGTLFRRTQQLSTKTELVILLRPILVSKRNSKAWVRDLQHTDDNVTRLHSGYHTGGLAEVFGNEAERNPP